MTTASPTTLPPTTLVPTTPPPMVWDCDPLEMNLTLFATLSLFPGAERDPTKDRFYRMPEALELNLSIEGISANIGIDAEPLEMTLTLVEANPIMGKVMSGDALAIDLSLVDFGFTVRGAKANWVKWSKIGDLNFTLDESNLAGERPMDWKGFIYGIKKLGNKVMVYGQSGVSALVPTNVHYGMERVYDTGVLNKGALAGNEKVHYFIDKLYRLIKIDQNLNKLDYSEYISLMTPPVILSYDSIKKLLYICDGDIGYVFGEEVSSFGEGPVNVTGIGSQDELVVASSLPIVTPKFVITSDIYDFGTRKPKTITRLEVGTDLTHSLYSSIEYRNSYKDSFDQIGWHLVNPDGKSYPKCYGVEFRFKLMSYKYEYFEVDYIRLRGHIHGYSYLDETL